MTLKYRQLSTDHAECGSISRKRRRPSISRDTEKSDSKVEYHVNTGSIFSRCREIRRGNRRHKKRRRGPISVDFTAIIPSRAASRIWGLWHSMPIPSFARSTLYSLWGLALGCNLDEVEAPLHTYRSFQEFFSRKVKPDVHHIEKDPKTLVSPVDGTAVSLCEMSATDGVLEQVKGLRYHVDDFLGFHPTAKPGNKIYAAIIYLAPGDYHRYHSPTEWKVSGRTHFAGQLLPVNKFAVNLLPSLFCANERVCSFGEWMHGFFSFTSVGATNVGSMTLNFDSKLRTNRWRTKTNYVHDRSYDEQVVLERGEEIGKFRLGSTVVLVFEGPSDFEWDVSSGEKVRMGQSLGHSRAVSEEKTQFRNDLKASVSQQSRDIWPSSEEHATDSGMGSSSCSEDEDEEDLSNEA